MPPVPKEAAYLVNAFDELGRVHHGGWGAVPLPFTEIAAGVPWTIERERHVLRAMSAAYMRGKEIGDDGLGRAPWVP